MDDDDDNDVDNDDKDDDNNDGENTCQGLRHTCWQQENKLCSQDRDLLGRAGNHYHDYHGDYDYGDDHDDHGYADDDHDDYD